METIKKNFIDKSNWGPGEWQDEPDKVQWPDEKTGLPCLAVRHKSGGHWCGYVGVPEGHPFFSVEYSGCSSETKCKEDYCDHTPGHILDVHGGITFSNFCVEDGKENGICHLPGPGEPDRVWWLGFDCAHSGDCSPGFNEWKKKHGFSDSYEFYRDLKYVQLECAKLAQQIELVTNSPKTTQGG